MSKIKFYIYNVRSTIYVQLFTMRFNYNLFFCIQRDAYDDYARAYYIIRCYMFPEKSPSQQHHKYQARTFEHIGGTEVDTL